MTKPWQPTFHPHALCKRNYEVYEPQASARGSVRLKTSLAFYRGTVKVFETR